MTPLAPRSCALDLLSRYGRGYTQPRLHAGHEGLSRITAQTSVFAHSVAVAYVCVALALRLRLSVDMRALVRGALLHDYFLYDWHAFDGGAHRLHGLFHAGRALKNARAEYALSPIEENAIHRHMFPLTPIPPRCREGWLVCLADKVCARLRGISRPPTCALWRPWPKRGLKRSGRALPLSTRR